MTLGAGLIGLLFTGAVVVFGQATPEVALLLPTLTARPLATPTRIEIPTLPPAWTATERPTATIESPTVTPAQATPTWTRAKRATATATTRSVDSSPPPVSVEPLSHYDFVGARAEFFEVGGNSLGSAFNDASLRLPVPGDFGEAASVTTLRWTRYECDGPRLAFEYEVTVWLPLWRPGNPVASGVVAEWNAAVERLARHEQGHVTIWVNGLAEVVLPGTGCQADGEALKAWLDVLTARQADYDLETDHGRGD